MTDDPAIADGPADGPAGTNGADGTHSGGSVLLTVRPRRIAVYAVVSASIVLAVMIVVGLLLRGSADGVEFRTSDQVGLIGLGVVVGGAILLMARPRLQVLRSGVRVRNVLGENFYPWPLVHRVAFPEGANWAQLILPDDESHPVMAIQALDRQRAVAALREVRALHARYAPPVSERPAGREPMEDPNRPLGRLEIIDRQRATRRPPVDRTGPDQSMQ